MVVNVVRWLYVLCVIYITSRGCEQLPHELPIPSQNLCIALHNVIPRGCLRIGEYILAQISGATAAPAAKIGAGSAVTVGIVTDVINRKTCSIFLTPSNVA